VVFVNFQVLNKECGLSDPGDLSLKANSFQWSLPVLRSSCSKLISLNLGFNKATKGLNLCLKVSHQLKFQSRSLKISDGP